MKIKYSIRDINHFIEQSLIPNLNYRVICFYGNLGSGKTTLITRLLQLLGAADRGSSPTFGLVHEYRNAKNDLLAYHLDCYRLESAEEALDIGLEEYLAADCWIFIEWPEKIAGLLPDQRTEIHVRVLDSETRELVIHNLSG